MTVWFEYFKKIISAASKFWIVLIIPIFLSAQEISRGLEFKGRNPENGLSYPREERTRLILPYEKSLHLPRDYTFSFDIRFDDPRFYGHLLSMVQADSIVFSITYSSDSAESGVLLIGFNQQKMLLSLPVKKDEIFKKPWNKLEIKVPANRDKIEFTLNDRSVNFEHPGYIPSSHIRFQFGYDRIRYDVPSITIRNVNIFQKEQSLFCWPLNHGIGARVREIIKGYDGFQKNGIWSASHHFYWKSKALFNVTDIMDVVRFGKSYHRYFGATHTEFYVFDENAQYVRHLENPGPIKDKDFRLVFNDQLHEVYGIYNGDGTVAVWDSLSGRWQFEDTLWSNGQHHGAVIFFNRMNNLFTLSGYGYYTVKNGFFSYNTNDKKWHPVKLKGQENFTKRSGGDICPADKPEQFFLGGGRGNQSGRQEFGFQPLRDLYRLNLRDTSIIKLVDNIPIPDSSEYRQLFYLRSSNEFYLRCILSNETGAAQLFKWKIGENKAYAIGEPEFGGGKIFLDTLNYKLDLFKTIANKTDNLFTLYRFRLKMPVLTYKELELLGYENALGINPNWYIIGLFLFFVLVGVGLYHYRSLSLIRKLRRTNLRLNFFGGFLIEYNRQTLPLNFKPQNLELLLFLLISGHKQNNSYHLTLDQLSETFWPGQSKDKVKNSRSSALARFRQDLQNWKQIEIETANRHWALRFTEKYLSDYDLYRQLMEAGKTSAGVDALLSLFDKGSFCYNLHYDWLEPIKSEVEEQVLNFCWKQITQSNDSAMHERCLNIILKWEPLNEKAIEEKIRLLKNQGRWNQAVQVFDNFKKLYEELLNEPYPKNINNFIK